MGQRLGNVGQQRQKHEVHGSKRVRKCAAHSHDQGYCLALLGCLVAGARCLLLGYASHTPLWAPTMDIHCVTHGHGRPAITQLRRRPCRYGIRSVKILAMSGRVAVQDCAEAEDNMDARDKFFMHASRQQRFV